MPVRVQKMLAAAIGVVGLALLAMMVRLEGEPGLLPLVLALLGAIGYVAGHVRGRRRRR